MVPTKYAYISKMNADVNNVNAYANGANANANVSGMNMITLALAPTVFEYLSIQSMSHTGSNRILAPNCHTSQ